MKILLPVLALNIVSFLIPTASRATSFTFETLPGPNSLFFVTDVNDSGHYVGSGDVTSSGFTGFTYLGSQYQVFNVPGFTDTTPIKINNSDEITGYYTDSRRHGFIYDGQNFVTVDGPLGSVSSQFNGLSDSGDAVGTYTTNTGGGSVNHAMLYHGGTLTTFSTPFDGEDQFGLNGINDAGDMVGSYVDSSGNEQSFWYNGTTYASLTGPAGTIAILADDINDSGEIAGWYSDALGTHGFTYDGLNYTTFDYPNAELGTFGLGISDNGVVAGDAVLNPQFEDNSFLAVEEMPEPHSGMLFAWTALCMAYVRGRGRGLLRPNL